MEADVKVYTGIEPKDKYSSYLFDEVRKRTEKFLSEEAQKGMITQNQAYKRFGRLNVERWVKQGKVNSRLYKNSIKYKMSDLIKAAESRQIYY